MMKGYCSRGNVASAMIWCLLQEVRVANRHHLRTGAGHEAARRGDIKERNIEANPDIGS